MRKTVFCVAVGITFLAAPMAHAAPNSLTLSPDKAAPGAAVTVLAKCNKKDISLRSDVLEDVVLKGQPAELRGSTTVKKDAKPGNYIASMKCGGATVRARITVLPGPAVDASSEGDVANTAGLLPSSSPGAGTFVLGGVALLATAGAGFFALRWLRKDT